MAEKAVPDLAKGSSCWGRELIPVAPCRSPGWGCSPEGHRVSLHPEGTQSDEGLRQGWAPSPLSNGITSPRLQAVPTSRPPASCSQTSPGSSNKGGVWVTHGTAGQGAVPSLGWGQGQCQGVAPAARPIAGMLRPGSGDHPRGSSLPPLGQSRAGPAGIPARCQAALGWKMLSVSREQLMIIAGGLLTY